MQLQCHIFSITILFIVSYRKRELIDAHRRGYSQIVAAIATNERKKILYFKDISDDFYLVLHSFKIHYFNQSFILFINELFTSIQYQTSCIHIFIHLFIHLAMEVTGSIHCDTSMVFSITAFNLWDMDATKFFGITRTLRGTFPYIEYILFECLACSWNLRILTL